MPLASTVVLSVAPIPSGLKVAMAYLCSQAQGARDLAGFLVPAQVSATGSSIRESQS